MTPATTTAERKPRNRAERRDLRQTIAVKTGRGSADAGMRTAEDADDEAADDARQKAGRRLGARGHRHAQAKRQRDEKDDDARDQIAGNGFE